MSLGRLRPKVLVSVVAVAAITLSACSNGSSSKSSSSASPGGAASAGGQHVTLTVAAWEFTQKNGPDIEAAAVKTFEQQHPNVTVKLQPIPYANYDSTVATELGTDAAPDVAQLSDVGFAQAIAGKAIVPLDGLVNDSGFKSRLLPENAWGVRDGKRYGYLWSLAIFGMFYNKPMLEAAGLKVPTTFQEFVTDAKALTDKSKGQYGFAMRSTLAEASGWFPQLSMWVAGDNAQYTDGNKVTINTPQMKQAINDYLAMYHSGAMLTGATAATYRQLFAAGKVGMTFDNGLGIQEGAFPQMKGKIYAAPTPLPGKQLVLPIYLGISAHSKHQQLAAQFIENFLSKPVQDQLSVALQGELPATYDYSHPSAAYQEYLKTAYWVGPLESKVGSAVPPVPAGPLSGLSPQISQAMLSELSKVQAGQETVDQMLANAQSTVEKAAASQ